MSKYHHEQLTAIEAVRAASRVCQSVQKRLVSAETLQKKDKSPVTVADFASQAVVCAKLTAEFPDDVMIAEEDSAELREPAQAGIRRIVLEQVGAVVSDRPDEDEILDWIDHGASASRDPARLSRRFWTLDPIDGTKGFLRAEQYAVALALIEDGRVVMGALACPNLPIEGGAGALLIAVRGQGARIIALESEETKGRALWVSQIDDPSKARFCESVESGHSEHDHSVKIARALGITAEAMRMDSQAKYAAVARGDAQIYLRLPTRADYQEKIWDHAAGVIVVEEAGGKVTDVAGKPLDFTHGPTLAANKGVVATNGRFHERVIESIGAAG